MKNRAYFKNTLVIMECDNFRTLFKSVIAEMFNCACGGTEEEEVVINDKYVIRSECKRDYFQYSKIDCYIYINDVIYRVMNISC